MGGKRCKLVSIRVGWRIYSGCAYRKTAFVPNSMLITVLTQALRTGGACAAAHNNMQLFMWQHDIVGVAHYIKDCSEVLGALDDAPDDASTSSYQPWRLDRYNLYIH